MGFFSYQIRKLYVILKNEVIVLPSRIAACAFFVFVLSLPLFTADPYVLRIFVLTGIFAIFAASWDLLSGFTGQINFGHALFFGVGAYGAAILNTKFQLHPLLSIPIASIFSVMVGLIVGIPCLRLRGTYLALATLAFPIILMGIVFMIPSITGGELGISGLRSLTRSRLADYYVVTILMLLAVSAMWKITDSNFGILLHAVREDEIASRASGINTVRIKLIAFSLSGFFAGIGGGLYAHFMRIVGPSTLEISLSFSVVIWSVFGGMVTIYGPVGAVFLIFPLLEFLRLWPEYRTLIFAVFILVVLLYMPEGLFPWIRNKLEIECPRCKKRNFFKREICRVCLAPLGVTGKT